MQNCRIVCAHRYLPELTVDNDKLSEFVDTSDEWISSRTGIKERHISTGENTSYMAAKVCEGLLSKSGIDPLDIDLLIVATITPDYLTPSTACLVQGMLGMKNAFAYDINAACSGFVYSLSTAAKFIASGQCKNAIVVGADLLSKIIDWTDRKTCVLFGDGAGGVLLSASEEKGIVAESLHSNGTMAMSLYGREMPVQNPFTAQEASKDSAYIYMNGREIFDFTVKEVPKSIKNILEQQNLDFEDIKYIIPHQANARIVEVIAKKLKIDVSKFYVNIARYGNTTAGTIPIALSEMLDQGLVTIGSGEKLLFAGFGGGLTWGTMLVEL